ncbi:MAG: hypothetical protein WCK47_13900 [bacterium]|nr:hypothetical protein [Candidatus Sumerlaeota bacterium]
MIYIYAVGLVLALWWIKEVLGRLPSDIEELRTGDWGARLAVLVIWLITVILMTMCARFVWQLAAPILRYFI